MDKMIVSSCKASLTIFAAALSCAALCTGCFGAADGMASERAGARDADMNAGQDFGARIRELFANIEVVTG